MINTFVHFAAELLDKGDIVSRSDFIYTVG